MIMPLIRSEVEEGRFAVGRMGECWVERAEFMDDYALVFVNLLDGVEVKFTLSPDEARSLAHLLLVASCPEVK